MVKEKNQCLLVLALGTQVGEPKFRKIEDHNYYLAQGKSRKCEGKFLKTVSKTLGEAGIKEGHSVVLHSELSHNVYI